MFLLRPPLADASLALCLRVRQAVPRRHRIGIGDAQRQFVFQQHSAAVLERAEHTTVLAMGVAALQAGKSVLSVSRSASLSSSPPTRASVSTLPTMRVPGSSGPRAVPGQGWLLPGKSLAQELHEHQGLDPVAHAHAPREGSRGRSSVLEGAGGMARPPVLCLGTLHNQCLPPVDQFLHLPIEGLSIQP